MKTKPKYKNFKPQPPPSTIKLHAIDNYLRSILRIETNLKNNQYNLKNQQLICLFFEVYTKFKIIKIY